LPTRRRSWQHWRRLAATPIRRPSSVTAALSDGSQEDVTALALYSSNDDAIAEVGKQGDVHVVGRRGAL
jgi:hypothetical protein